MFTSRDLTMHALNPDPPALQGHVLLGIAWAVEGTASSLRYDTGYLSEVGTNNPFGDEQLKVRFLMQPLMTTPLRPVEWSTHNMELTCGVTLSR